MRSLFWRLQRLCWRSVITCGILWFFPGVAAYGRVSEPTVYGITDRIPEVKPVAGYLVQVTGRVVLPDTLRNFNPTGEQRHFAVDTLLSSGFVFGTNIFSDQAKATSFSIVRVPGADSVRIHALRIWFGYKKANLAASTGYKVALYRGNAVDGPQGEPMAYFLPLVSSIRADENLETDSEPTVLTFEPFKIPDDFFVSVEFGALSSNPGALEIAASGPTGGRVAEVWEMTATGAWQNVSDAWWSTQQEGAQLWIEVIVEGQIATGTEDPDVEVPTTTQLHQNYPNPFNPSTSIRYELDRSGPVSLVVFDVTGRRVTELVNGLQGAGRYEVPFDAGNLASGIYFYRLTAGNFVTTRKMLLVR